MSHIWHEYGRAIIENGTGMDCTKCSHQNAELCNINETPDNLFKKYVVKRTDFLLDIYEKKSEYCVLSRQNKRKNCIYKRKDN